MPAAKKAPKSAGKYHRKSRSVHGGKRRNAGRKPGSANKVTVLIKGSLAETARGYTAEMLGVLVEIALNEKLSPGARTTAAVAMLDRGHGKATQAIEHSGPDGAPIQHEVSDLDVARRIHFLLQRAANAPVKDKPDG